MVSSTDIKRILSIAGCLTYCDPVILDSSYSCPDKDWIEREFSAEWFNFKGQVMSYTKECWDCDNYAFLCFSYAQACHARLGGVKTGLAFGVITFLKNGLIPHAANFFLSGDSLIGYEPQTCEVFYFTDKEKESITNIIV